MAKYLFLLRFVWLHPSLHFYSLFRIMTSCVFLFIGMHSGKVQAQTAAPNQVIFRDDFNRSQLGPNWNAPSYAKWSLVGGNAYNFIDGTDGTLRTTTAFNSLSYVIETSAKGFTSGYFRSFFITFGQSSLSQKNFYTLNYTPYTGGQLTLGKVNGNVHFPTVLDEVILSPKLGSDSYYSFRIERYRSGLMQVYLNRGNGYETIPLLEAIDSTYQGLGHFGWQVNNESSAEPFYVEYMEARVPAAEKPAIPQKPIQDKFITQVSTANGKTYPVAKLNAGVKQYADRTYTITSVPVYLQGASFIQTANTDKNNTQTDFLSAFIKPDVIAFIGYDPRATSLPAWLSDWTKTGDRIGTTDPGSSYLDVYSKPLSSSDVYPNPLILGGNLSSPAVGSNMNYLLAVIPNPGAKKYEAEAAKVVGAKIANDKVGYSGTGFVDYVQPSGDYVEWTVNASYSGSYALLIGYAQGSNSSRTLAIQVDGKVAQNRSFISTGSWQTWATQTGPSVYLTAGIHTVRATSVGTKGPNLDYLSLVPTDATPGNRAARLISHDESARISPVVAYPNPSQGRTTFRYILREGTPVRLTVLDKTGKTVQVVVNALQSAGMQEVTFDGSQLTGGLYLYRLEAGKDSQVGKILLVK